VTRDPSLAANGALLLFAGWVASLAVWPVWPVWPAWPMWPAPHASGEVAVDPGTGTGTGRSRAQEPGRTVDAQGRLP
jgi:hypothetical protein